ncbi:hypothetical protein [Desulfovibrio psychrotolerans]|uniref:Cyclodipeptide synthase n=1 Tax=Desulfovibrio psychrotolerans TaxID=415242 RepID=A0A7J0BPW4_9BACT|nr:hypothetical protein [Desulfovibrio psychrotolerans]GFM35743.1 hypothetical protein DSM19430T_04270 [Desulfovibrio psychrotolerans]
MWHDDKISPNQGIRSDAQKAFAEAASGRELYVAKFRNLQFEKQALYDNICFVPISLGQEYHEGGKFASIMRLVEKSFKECVIIVSDVLHRHTLVIEDASLDAEQALSRALEKGRQWVAANSAHWKDLSIPCRVVYWGELLHSEAYMRHRRELDALCSKSYCANHLVDEMVGHFVRSACAADAGESERARVAALSREYLLEEHAIQLRMIPEQFPEHHFVYPHTNRLDPLMELYRIISGCQCRWLRVRISRRDGGGVPGTGGVEQFRETAVCSGTHIPV